MGRVSRGFQGTDRYRVQRRLGAGGMGVVYEALDQVRNEVVALKTLIQFDAEAVYRIKQEFRALADVQHPNLVALHELVSHEGQWFFTMERVEGEELLSWLRRVPAPPPVAVPIQQPMGSEEETETIETEAGPDGSTGDYSLTRVRLEGLAPAPLEPRPRSTPRRIRLDAARLKLALAQVGEALTAIHEAGKVHRDIKPSNVLVTEAGRVVVLDFGLATELYDAFLIRSTQQGVVCGTIAYMSPEQSAGEALTPASDFYSVGVMLYEAYTGQLPFGGAMYQVVLDKQEKDAPRISALVPEVPKALDDLCARLLSRDPKERPVGRAFAEALGVEPASYTTGPIRYEGADASGGPVFVGRAEELSVLERAFQRSKSGEVVVVELVGPAGIGKSALLRKFVDQRTTDQEAAVLVGRCYERELVPFKAVDGFFDALARYLRRLSMAEARALAPPEAKLLVRLFPVLGRVEALTGASQMPLPLQPAELRRLAFAGLRELIRRLCLRQPLVFVIDDVQHGDADSGELISALLVGSDPPPVLWMLVHRTGPTVPSGDGPLLEALARSGVFRRGLESLRLELGPLPMPDATQLAVALLARGLGPAENLGALPETAKVLAKEAGGVPLLLHELASYDLASGPQGTHFAFADPSHSRIERAAEVRFQSLPAEAQRLLEVVALCPGPVALVVANQAAGLPPSDRVQASLLAARRMVRTEYGRMQSSPNRGKSAAGERETIEVLHDRARRAALNHLSAEVTRGLHLGIARALQARPEVPLEASIHHLEQAGAKQEAAEHSMVAARAAAEGLAFDRAANLYGLALSLGAGPRGVLLEEQAEVLANAGLGPESAQAFLEAAERAQGIRRLELWRRAAEQYLITGHVEQGLLVFERVLAEVGLRLPKDAQSAVRATAIFRGALWLRGLHFDAKDPAEIDPAMLQRIDVCWSLVTGLGMVDAVRAAYFGTRMLGYALSAGEPERAVKALAFEVAMIETLDPSSSRGPLAMRSLRWAARKVETPHSRSLVALAAGFSGYMRGQFAAAKQELERAALIARFECVGARWEAETSHYLHLACLGYLGELEQLGRLARETLLEPRARLSLYASTLIRVSPHVGAHLLAADQPAELILQVEEAMRRWSVRGYFLEDFLATSSLVQAELYLGHGKRAAARLAVKAEDLERSLLTRMQLVNLEVEDLRARTALGWAADGGGEDPLKDAIAAARRIDSVGIPHARGLAALIRAQLAEHRGRPARPLYEEARRAFKESGLQLQAALVVRRLAILDKDQAGRRSAEQILAELGVVAPESYARVWLPLVSR
ncbi:MAG: protein kinase [Deltaproteobacteria bacterium]|nr:protein kinase [Deltaproteobacteria bacterium]